MYCLNRSVKRSKRSDDIPTDSGLASSRVWALIVIILKTNNMNRNFFIDIVLGMETFIFYFFINEHQLDPLGRFPSGQILLKLKNALSRLKLYFRIPCGRLLREYCHRFE